MDFLLAVAFGFAKALSRQKDQFVAPITLDIPSGSNRTISQGGNRTTSQLETRTIS